MPVVRESIHKRNDHSALPDHASRTKAPPSRTVTRDAYREITYNDPRKNKECCRHVGLAPPCPLPRRRPGAVLPHRDVGSGSAAGGAGEGGLPALLRDQRVPAVGPRERSGRRRLGRDERRRAPLDEASRWPSGPRSLRITGQEQQAPRGRKVPGRFAFFISYYVSTLTRDRTRSRTSAARSSASPSGR